MVIATTAMDHTGDSAVLDAVLKQFRSATSAPEIYLRFVNITYLWCEPHFTKSKY